MRRRLSDADVEDIIRLRAEGRLYKDVAALYGVSIGHLCRIVTGQSRSVRRCLNSETNMCLRGSPESVVVTSPLKSCDSHCVRQCSMTGPSPSMSACVSSTRTRPGKYGLGRRG